MSLSRWLASAAVWLATLGLTASPVAAQEADADRSARVGRLAVATGKVWVYDLEAKDWAEAEVNRPLVQGDRIAVDPDGRAEIRLGAVVLRVDGDSELELQALDEGRVEAWLVNGGLAMQVLSDAAARQTRLRTREGSFDPLGPGHYRLEADEQGSHAGVWRGAMQYQGPENLLRIDHGERYRVWLAADTGYARSESEPMPTDALSSWALAAEREPVYRADTLPDGMVGGEDLDRYGHWALHGEYGRIWIPARVPYGWAPYTQGRWVWVRPWGWTWVDAAPWGFAPFHYGRWLRWGGRWAWWPGPVGARAVFAPALVFQAGGPSVSVGVSIDLGLRNAPPVSWVPLAPYQPYYPVWRPPPRPDPHAGRPPVVVVVPPPPYHHHPDRRVRPPRPVQPGPITYGADGTPRGVRTVQPVPNDKAGSPRGGREPGRRADDDRGGKPPAAHPAPPTRERPPPGQGGRDRVEPKAQADGEAVAPRPQPRADSKRQPLPQQQARPDAKSAPQPAPQAAPQPQRPTGREADAPGGKGRADRVSRREAERAADRSPPERAEGQGRRQAREPEEDRSAVPVPGTVTPTRLEIGQARRGAAPSGSDAQPRPKRRQEQAQTVRDAAGRSASRRERNERAAP